MPEVLQDPPVLTSIFLAVYCFILMVRLDRQKARIDSLNARIKDPPPPPPPQPSEELTDFLSDFKKYGYSFVRVDPGSVFMRLPRD